ncbi:RNA polymerase sigma24 factor [Lentzea sp. NBRC 105346]|uniref:SigE family RNA polymerase sigma factor n=1 Tax=Lentzea sp. NBRC 105346 TaxID=3032205 RepID=UPI0024A2A006|nr:SigE family RNA polymerase sigma factor [Lentzea sp. NBRC 105346]GLZ31040.1 RNA polymerase sigma24 factor [Lentzea sp. NBRC 105346]
MPEGYEQFVADRLDRLLRYATAMTCDKHLAQDIVQNVLIKAQRRWDRINAMTAPYLYVKRMVTNEYLSWRHRKAARDLATEHAKLAEIGPAIQDHATQHAERDAMRKRIAMLPRQQRAALVLRFYEDSTDAEIAEILGCTEGTVRSHISRALSTLRATQPFAEEALR